MAFLRKKTIKGHDYLYLVENVREDGKVRQRVLRYLGRADLVSPMLVKRVRDALAKGDSAMATRAATAKSQNSEPEATEANSTS